MQFSMEPELQRPSTRMGRVVQDGYIYIYQPSHPRAKGHNGYVAEHVLVMENKIGRRLRGKECVHHEDENRSNNVASNLVLMKNGAEHARLHGSTKPAPRIELNCSFCRASFQKQACKITCKMRKGQTRFYCSRSCMGKAAGRGRAHKPS